MKNIEVDKSNWTEKDWNKFLDETEGNIDKEFGVSRDVVETVNSLDYNLSLETNGLKIYTSEGDLIGYIRKGRFTDSSNSIDSDNHLEKYVDDNFRGMGYGTVLLHEYINAGFDLPIEEYTGDIKVVGLMEKFGYRAVSYFEYGFEYEITNSSFSILPGMVVKLKRE